MAQRVSNSVSTHLIDYIIRDAFPEDGAYVVDGTVVFLHKRRVYACGLTEYNKVGFALTVKSLADTNRATA